MQQKIPDPIVVTFVQRLPRFPLMCGGTLEGWSRNGAGSFADGEGTTADKQGEK